MSEVTRGPLQLIDIPASHVTAPTPGMIADVNAVYRLNEPPWTRYISDGTRLASMVTGDSDTAPAIEALPLTGGTLTGPLYLDADPEGDQPLRAATKHYVDHVDNLKLNAFGGEMTGPLILVGDPVQPLEAATKQYVDASTMGVIDGSEAGAGEIGEYVVMADAEGVAMSSNVPVAICSLDLTPGDWDIWGTVDFRPASGVSPNAITASISTHADALPTDEDLLTGVGVLNMFTTSSLTTGQRQVLMTGTCRSNSAAPLTVYLVGQTTLGGSGVVTGKGYICARRAR